VEIDFNDNKEGSFFIRKNEREVLEKRNRREFLKVLGSLQQEGSENLALKS